MAIQQPRISPILADLSQDIAGAIPLDLILLWNTSQKSEAKHSELLQPYIRSGIVVSSDSAGLSRLSAELSLLEVMQLVSQPKEIIYAYGKGVGGESIGMWVADNTQMFYGSSITAQEIVEAMIAAQHEIKSLRVQVGIGIHQGEFLEIGGGLYGQDALYIEELAENHTQGGQITISHSVQSSLLATFCVKLSAHSEVKDAFLLDYSEFNPQVLKHNSSYYPFPFNKDFFEFLQSYNQLSESERLEHYTSFSREKVVILIKIKHLKQTLMLEELTGFIVANAYISQVVKEYPEVSIVKSNGDLGIFVCDKSELAIEFARKIHEKLSRNDFTVNIGVASGEVLLFPLQSGYEIAGGPVNIASKLAEDSGHVGKILIEESVDVHIPQAEPFSFTLSKVVISGRAL